MDPSVRLVRRADVLWRRVGDGAVLTSLDREGFQHLSASGAAVWDALESPRTTGEVAELLAPAFGVPSEQIEADVASLADALLTQGLIEAATRE